MSKKAHFLLSLFSFVAISGLAQSQPPQAILRNRHVRATLYLPDTQKGYYRGSRFDWSGVIADLTAQHHSYFGVWNDKYEPTLHDAISGPVEEFSTIGYDKAKVGESFLKIGVGMLQKPDEPRNTFTTPYQITNGGQWSTRTRKRKVDFRHELTDASGYGYQYRKTVRLPTDKPMLILEHRLKNTGKETIETDVYNHNFLVLDKQASGPDFTVTFPYPIQTNSSLNGILVVNGNDIRFLRKLNKGESVYALIQGYAARPEDYAIRVENRQTGAGIKITADQPLSKLAFWTNPANLSPEPFIHLRLGPGEEMRWTISYEFYSVPPAVSAAQQ